MTNEIEEILENIKKCCDITKDQSFTVYQRQDILKLLDYITNLQEKYNIAQKDVEALTNNYNDLVKMSENKITNLQEEVKSANESITWWQNRFNALHKENERLNRKIQIKNNWADLLIRIGYDYDGYNKVESLKVLIDELVDFAYKIKENDETTIIYENNGKTYSILDEEIKGEDNE